MTLRNAEATDADRLANLSEQLGYPVDSEVVGRRLERLLARAEHIVLVADSPTSGVVGWIHAAEHDILEVGRFCEILGLVIAADQRGQGVGRLLVEQVEGWATRRGLEHVSVRSNAARSESHPFYERIGYARVKTQHVYRKQI
jgi:GNAT superfamily N-acetyltransferase